MSSRTWTFVALLALAGCTVKHGTPARGAAAGAAAAPADSSGAPMPGPLHGVFDSLRESVAPGVARISLSVMLPPGLARDAQQTLMQMVLDAERRADSGLAAIRVLGFLPPPPDHAQHPSGMRMIPFAILTWAPAGGWNALTAANARGPHTTDALFVTDLKGHQPVPGAEEGGHTGGGNGGGGGGGGT